MKKIKVIAATGLVLAGLGSQSLVAQAAPMKQIAFPMQSKQWEYSQEGNKIIISYGGNCNIQDILGQLENCFPSVNLPGGNCPEINLPGLECPGTNCPETDCPDANCPDTDCPGTNCPETESPDVNVPGPEAPENNNPGTDTPENERPEENLPGTGTPDVNIPETDAPGNTPENNNPGNNGSTDTTPEESPEEDSSDNNTHPYLKQVVDLVNAERAKEGLAPLTVNTKVQAAAQVRAMESEKLFSHTRPDGSSFATALKEQGVSYRRAGENIAWGQRTPQQVVNAWMNSAGHRANIMNPNFTTIGVGYYQNANGTNYWCQLFTN